MHVDAEGMDDVILRQIDPAASWAPRFLLFERKHLDRRRYRTLRSWLRHNGYAVASLWPDAFAYRRRPW
jgi:hypothetical protein